MNQYYILEGKEIKGPFTANELILHQVDIKTLVMVEGIDNWVYASEIPELVIHINHHKQQDSKTP